MITARDTSVSRTDRLAWLRVVALLALVAIAYQGTGNVPFLLDDRLTITENPSIRDLHDLRQVAFPPVNTPTAGRPLANLSFAVSFALSGNQPWGHHLLNVAVHALAAIVLMGVVRRTLLLPALAPRWGQAADFVSLAVAALWAVHPLQTQAVTYLAQRTESLMALCYLLAIYAFIRGTAGAERGWYVLAVASAVAGALTKEVIATAPLAILLYDRTFVAGTFREAWRRRWRVYASLALIWPLIGWLLADVKHRGVGLGLGITAWNYALTQSQAVLTYLSLSLWPHPLLFDYPPHFASGLADVAPQVVCLGAILAVLVFSVRRWPKSTFAAVWFFLLLVPSSSVVPITGAPIAENRTYLPLAGLIVSGVLLISLASRRIAQAGCALLVLVLAFQTVLRNRTYGDAILLWSDTVAKAPGNVRAHNNLASLLAGRPGQDEAARAHFETALRLAPDYADAHDNLGKLLARDPVRRSGAREHFDRALELRPDHVRAHNNLGRLLATDPARQAEAIGHFETARRLKPADPEAYYNLAVHHASRPGEEALALDLFQTALRLNPDFGEAHNDLGDLLSRQPGHEAEALQHFQAALRILPDNAIVHFNLAEQYERIPAQRERALAHYHAALRLDPTMSPARDAIRRLGERG